MKRILILGISGMLGSMLTYRLSLENYDLFTTLRDLSLNEKFPKSVKFFKYDINIDSLRTLIETIKPEYIINCVGITKPFCKDNDMKGVKQAISANAFFPHILAGESANIDTNIKIIQIATDCVYNGRKGNYSENDPHNPEDVYGKTKSLGEVIASNVLNIRCSIIGPELNGHTSLLDWFLYQKPGSTVNGFTHHHWNGITTLQFANLCHMLIMEDNFDQYRAMNHVIHYVANECLTKFELLEIFKKEFQKDLTILPVNNIGEPINRIIRSIYLNNDLIPMNQAISQLNNFIVENKIYTSC